MHKKDIQHSGKKIEEAQKAVILLHGRGASARDIFGLAIHLGLEDYAQIAPQATNNTWYPYSFLAELNQNEPWLSSALDILEDLLKELKEKGFASKDIYLAGFSQGACLCLEFAARNAQNFGGIAAFTGGLIGDKIYPENYEGDFENTPIFIGTGNPDAHVPVERVQESAEILKKMNADVKVEVYLNRLHTISEDELELTKEKIFN